MPLTAYSSRALYTPTKALDHPVVLVEQGKIVKLGTRDSVEAPVTAQVRDFGEAAIAPGFIDIHIHGSAGYDVMQEDDNARAAFERFLARKGVTAYYPTTVAAPIAVTERALERMANAIAEANREDSGGDGRAQPMGVHLEGPFLSHARCGAHRPEDLLAPTMAVFEKLWQAARGTVRVMTIAPELDGAMEVIAGAKQRGVCVSFGHSDADLEVTRRAVAAGARHATHTFNAMRPLVHRDPGILAEVLTNTRLTADVIADGFHVDPTIVQLFLNAKGVDQAVLITDATAGTGMPDGKYPLGLLTVEVKDGRVMKNGNLAGSVLTMDGAVRNAMKFAGWDLQSAVRAATENPAHVTGLVRKGILEPGADADFVVLNASGEVRAAVVGGKVAE